MKRFIAAFLVLCWPAIAYGASESANIVNQQSQVIQNQKQIEHENIIRVELNQIKKEQEKQERDDDDWEEDDLSQNDGKVVQNLRSIQCFRPRQIIFSDNQLLTAEEQNSLAQKYLNKCLTLDWVTKFDKEVEALLSEKGYVTSRSQTSKKSLMRHKMQVQIIPGMLEKVIVNEDSFADKAQLFTTFGFDDLPKGGRILNIHDLEPGLERFNRLSSNHAILKIIKGSAPNQSIVVIENHAKNTAKINLSYDNIGSKNTGVRRETIGFSQDNLLHLNDVFSISRTSNDLDPKRDRRSSNVVSGGWSVPVAQHVFSLLAAKSTYSFLTGSSGTVLANGFVLTKAVNVESALYKYQRYKLNSNISFAERENQIFNDDVRNEGQSRKAVIATAALSNTFFLESGTLFLKPSYSTTLNVLNAKQDDSSVSRTTTHAEFTILKFYANYSQKFSLPYFEDPASYSFSFDSQKSQNHLYSIDQFSSGGFYSVRGFRQGSILGDSGFNIRNEFTTNLGQLILPRISSCSDAQYLAELNHFSLTPFYDYGYVETRGFHSSGRLSSGGFKISFEKKSLKASMTFAHTITSSRMMNQDQGDSNTFYFDIGTDFNFL